MNLRNLLYFILCLNQKSNLTLLKNNFLQQSHKCKNHGNFTHFYKIHFTELVKKSVDEIQQCKLDDVLHSLNYLEQGSANLF